MGEPDLLTIIGTNQEDDGLIDITSGFSKNSTGSFSNQPSDYRGEKRKSIATWLTLSKLKRKPSMRSPKSNDSFSNHSAKNIDITGSCILDDEIFSTAGSNQLNYDPKLMTNETSYPTIPPSLISSGLGDIDRAQFYTDDDELDLNIIIRFNDRIPISRVSEVRAATLIYLVSIDLPISTKLLITLCVLDRNLSLKRSPRSSNTFELKGVYSLGSFQSHTGGEYRNIGAWSYVLRDKRVVPIYGILTTKVHVNKGHDRSFPPMDGLTYAMGRSRSSIMRDCQVAISKGRMSITVGNGFNFEQFAYNTAGYLLKGRGLPDEDNTSSLTYNGLFILE